MAGRWGNCCPNTLIRGPARIIASGYAVQSADPDRLRQVLLNLIKNALEVISEEGQISLRAWEESGAIFLEVRHKGEGLPQERLEETFEPFVTSKKGGSGLGLPLCRKIVQGHGGEIKISSRPGQGARTRVMLPAAF